MISERELNFNMTVAISFLNCTATSKNLIRGRYCVCSISSFGIMRHSNVWKVFSKRRVYFFFKKRLCYFKKNKWYLEKKKSYNYNSHRIFAFLVNGTFFFDTGTMASEPWNWYEHNRRATAVFADLENTHHVVPLETMHGCYVEHCNPS